MSTPASWRERLFGDRGAALRAGLTLAALVVLVVYTETAWEETHPAIEKCFAAPARHDGKTTFMGPARVETADAAGFAARNIWGTVVRVEAPPGTPAAAGETVALRGVFHKSGDPSRAPGYIALDVENGRPVIRPAPHGFEKRYGMFAVSAAVLAVVAWRLFRAFRWAPGGLDVRLRPPTTGD
jgi:hypothetical protein